MSSFTYDDIKKQLKAIYDNLSSNEIKGSTTEIKVENTSEVKIYEKSDRLDGCFSEGQSNAYKESRGHGYNRFKENNQTSDQGDNLVIHELKILLISMVVSSCAFSVNLSLV